MCFSLARRHLRRRERLVGIVAEYTIARDAWAMYQNAPKVAVRARRRACLDTPIAPYILPSAAFGTWRVGSPADSRKLDTAMARGPSIHRQQGPRLRLHMLLQWIPLRRPATYIAAALLVALAAAGCGAVDPDAGPPMPNVRAALDRSDDDAITLPLRIDRDVGDVPEYDRGEWRHWLDEDDDCQDARQETLIAEADGPLTYETDDNCRVETGRWVDPYTLAVFEDPSDLDVDHVVPLANAHRSGGWAWTRERKADYANDLNSKATWRRWTLPRTAPREAWAPKTGARPIGSTGAITPWTG